MMLGIVGTEDLTMKTTLHKTKKEPRRKCCKNPYVKNEGYVTIKGVDVWEYHCYECMQSWTEKDVDKTVGIK